MQAAEWSRTGAGPVGPAFRPASSAAARQRRNNGERVNVPARRNKTGATGDRNPCPLSELSGEVKPRATCHRPPAAVPLCAWQATSHIDRTCMSQCPVGVGWRSWRSWRKLAGTVPKARKKCLAKRSGRDKSDSTVRCAICLLACPGNTYIHCSGHEGISGTKACA